MARKADVRKVRDYELRCPERTLLYQLFEERYPQFLELLITQGRSLPAYVQHEFDNFLKCDILEHGFPYGTGAKIATACAWWHLDAYYAASVSAAALAGWLKAPCCWSTKSCPTLPMRQWVLSFPFPQVPVREPT